MVLITKKSYKVIQKLKKKAYKKKYYYYNLRKSITSETLMPICGFAPVCDITKIVKVAKTNAIVVQYIQVV